MRRKSSDQTERCFSFFSPSRVCFASFYLCLIACCNFRTTASHTSCLAVEYQRENISSQLTPNFLCGRVRSMRNVTPLLVDVRSDEFCPMTPPTTYFEAFQRLCLERSFVPRLFTFIDRNAQHLDSGHLCRNWIVSR